MSILTKLTPWSENLETNAKDLPPHLSQCLSYFGQFPRDAKISSRRLVVLWVAEGLVKQSGDKQEPLKSVAEKYLSELIKRNLVQEVERKLNGRVKTCSFPSVLRELWLRENPSSGFDQHVLYYSIEKDSSFGGNINSSTPNILQSIRNPLSLLCFDTRERDKPGVAFGHYHKKGIASGHLLYLKRKQTDQIQKVYCTTNSPKLQMNPESKLLLSWVTCTIKAQMILGLESQVKRIALCRIFVGLYGSE